MIRFVRSPDNQVTVDINGKLPGRGVWISADKTKLDQAIKSKGFARGFKGPAHIADDLEAQIIAALLRQLSGQLAMAKKSGQLIIGFDQVFGAAAKMPLAFRIEASDGAADGRGKIRARARALSYEMELAPPQVIGCFDAGQLGQIFGREHTIHAAMPRGKMAQNMQRLMKKLVGFYPLIPANWPDRDHEHIDKSGIG